MANSVSSYVDELAVFVVENLKKEFSEKYLSKNLIRSIETRKNGNIVQIIIPADIYDFKTFFTKGAVVKTNTGSYANKLDVEGSWFTYYNKKGKKRKKVSPKNHKGYVQKVVDDAVSKFVSKHRDIAKKVSK